MKNNIIAIIVSFSVFGCDSQTITNDNAFGNTLGLSQIDSTDHLYASCGQNSKFKSAQTGVLNWLEVIRHVDECDLSKTRYYSSTSTQKRLASNINISMREIPSGFCRNLLSQWQSKINSAFLSVRDWERNNWNYCTIEFRDKNYAEAEARFFASTQKVRCDIYRSFPEIAGEIAC